MSKGTLNMATKPRLDAADRTFFTEVGRAVFLNPFSEERERILGRIHSGHEGEALRLDPKTYWLVAKVSERVRRLDNKASNTLAHFSEHDRPLIARVYLYEVYHRYVGEIDALIAR